MAHGIIAIGMGSTFIITTFLMLDMTLIIKCLYMYKWPLMSGIDDDFFDTFIAISATLFGTLAFCIRWSAGEFEANSHVTFFAGKNEEKPTEMSEWSLCL